MRPQAVAIRIVHGAITAFFSSCIAFVYYAGVTGEQEGLAWLAAAAIGVEGAVVALNGGDCPLGPVHRRYGDDKAFFELLLPPRAAKLAVPVLGIVAAIGILLLIF